MQCYHIPEKGAPARLVDLPAPLPGAGEVRIAVNSVGLNFADLLMQKGTYQDTPEAPFTLGLEISGRIDALGAGVETLRQGQRVMAYLPSGGLAEFATVDARRVTPIPDAMPFQDAACFPVAYGTSHIALAHLARLTPGELLFVTGAAGGVGLTAVEIGALMGATVVAHARGAEKLAIAEAAGAKHLIDDGEDIRARLKALGQADVVYDAVGGEAFRAAFRAANPGGRILPIGFASGDVPQIPANHLLVKNLTVIGFYIGGYLKRFPEVIQDSMAQLVRWYEDGKLKPHIGAVFPLDQAEQGLALLKARKSSGKVIIKP